MSSEPNKESISVRMMNSTGATVLLPTQNSSER